MNIQNPGKIIPFFLILTIIGCLNHNIKETSPESYSNVALQKAIKVFHKGDFLNSIEILNELLSEYPTFAQNQDFLYLYALNYYMQKDWEKSIQAWENFLSKTPELNDYGLYYLADSLANHGDYYLAKETLMNLINSFPESRYAEISRIKIGEYLVRMGNTDEGFNHYQKLRSSISLNFHPDLLLSSGNSFEFTGNLEKAINAYLEIYVKFPLDEKAEIALSRINYLAELTGFKIPSEKLMERIINLINRTEYSLALKELENIDTGSLDAQQLGKYFYYRAICEYNLRLYNKALSSIEKALANYSKPADLLFLKGKTLSRLGKIEEARKTYMNLISDYPQSEWIDNAYYKLATLSYLENNFDDAIQKIDYLINNHPESDAIVDALWAKVWYSFRSGRTEDAINGLLTLTSRTNSGEIKNSSARYWLARLLESRDRTSAEAIYNDIILNKTPPDFYSLLALWRIKRKGELNIRMEPFISSINFQTSSVKLFHLEHARKLFSLGFNDDTLVELKLAEQETKSDTEKLLAVGNFYLSSGFYHDAIMLSQIYLPEYINDINNFSTQVAQLAYPRGYRQLIEEYSKKYNVDPNLIYAIILAESTFKSDSVSRANAIGLMQIIPLTGKFVASIAGLKDFTPEMLFDPEINLGLGIKYLSLLQEQYNSNLVLMLAHYNAGPLNLNNWLKNFNPNEVDIFVENIPFNETRDYIKKVITYYCIYSWLYGGNIDIARIFGLNDLTD